MSSRLFSTYLQSGTSTERQALTPIPPAIVWHETDTGNVYVHDQGGWVLLNTQGGITQLTGDGTAGPGSGSQALTLAASGVQAGTYGDSLHVNQVTVNAKGIVTGVVPVAIAANVVGPASSTSTDLAAFSGTTGTVLADSGIPSAQVARRDQENIFTQIQVIQTASTPALGLTETSAGTDLKAFDIYATGGLLNLRGINDAGTAYQPGIVIDKSGALTERGRGTPVGNWIDVPFSAANYGSMTVAAGNVSTHAYMLVGNTLWVTVVLTSVNVPSATATVSIAFAGQPGITASARLSVGTAMFWDPATTWDSGIAAYPGSANYFNIQMRNQGTFAVGTHHFYATLAISIG